ncbi:MAG: siderophore-interacting protein [Pseudomonadota bacterium]
MSIQDVIKKVVPKRRPPRLLTVSAARFVTPNMIRVTFKGPELEGINPDCAGGHCKLIFPKDGQRREDFAADLEGGVGLTRRTYTVRHHRPDLFEMDIDFVAHGDEGPASAWAHRAKPGSICGFAGPSQPKITEYFADWYLVAADMSALPVAAATLEAMPRDAKGIALLEVTTEADIQEIDMPDGIEFHWLIQPDPHVRSSAQEDFIRGMDWPDGRVQTCIAGESVTIRTIRDYLQNDRALPPTDTYISGYWKIGLIEDQHQQQRREGLAG